MNEFPAPSTQAQNRECDEDPPPELPHRSTHFKWQRWMARESIYLLLMWFPLQDIKFSLTAISPPRSPAGNVDKWHQCSSDTEFLRPLPWAARSLWSHKRDRLFSPTHSIRLGPAIRPAIHGQSP
ncbi:MAG: hypothetical protein KDA88_21270 [Planctomycetaceae bacterium]|nr:hypothetical protein [Planctomycetaceae bacterium]MCA9030240.1 hypothetical protein [Planctomycetaceae bacterium]MCB9949346.1 hypothetical protein [Planctomycetaceae bacterium]